MKYENLNIKVAFGFLLSLLLSICAFYIVHNAAWLVGDDSIVISHTGFGKPFHPKDTIFKGSGRFFPFSYLMYNILLPFSNGFISPKTHYCLHLVCYVLCILNFVFITLDMLKHNKVWLKYSLAICVAIIVTGRTIPNYLECYSTAWFSYYLCSVFLLALYMFIKNDKMIWGILTLIVVNFSIYRAENEFILSLSLGVLFLLLNPKPTNNRKRLFFCLLTASSLIFILIYSTFILPYIVDKYDSSHGTNISFINNAINILIAQKIILASIPFAIYRSYIVLKQKQGFDYFDIIYPSAWAMCLGGFILKLNWVLYYNIPALYMLMFILHSCSSFKWKQKWTITIFSLFALFYGAKIPESISLNQKKRIEQPFKVEYLSNLVNANNAIWYDPNINPEQHTVSMVNKDWITTQIAWYKHQKEFSIPTCNFDSEIPKSICFILLSENDHYLPKLITEQNEITPIFNESGIVAYSIK